MTAKATSYEELKANATPGEWEIAKHQETLDGVPVWEISGKQAAKWTAKVMAHNSDARLIVHEHNTYPKLLEALRAIVIGHPAGHPDHVDLSVAMQNGAAAIAAAEGVAGCVE